MGISDIDISPKGQQEAIDDMVGKSKKEKWFVIEKGDGWEVSFGSPNSENGCILVGPNAKKYAYLIVSLNNTIGQSK